MPTKTDGHWPLGTTLASTEIKVIGCECGAKPQKLGRMGTQHVWHMSHRRGLKLQPVEYQWPDDRYMVGLSTGGYQQMRGHEWRNGGWAKVPSAKEAREQELIRQALNECAGGLTCQHAITERREIADIVRRMA